MHGLRIFSSERKDFYVLLAMTESDVSRTRRYIRCIAYAKYWEMRTTDVKVASKFVTGPADRAITLAVSVMAGRQPFACKP